MWPTGGWALLCQLRQYHTRPHALWSKVESEDEPPSVVRPIPSIPGPGLQGWDLRVRVASLCGFTVVTARRLPAKFMQKRVDPSR